MCQTKEVGESIGATLGEVEKVDANRKGFYLGNFLRIRVLLDITLPLCQGRKVGLGEHGMKWVDLKYERLPIFCYLCRRVDHDERECMQGLRSNDTLRPKEKQFGQWLHATLDKFQKPQTITMVKNEEPSSGGIEQEKPDSRRDRKQEPMLIEAQSGSTHSGKAEEVGILRPDMVKVGDPPTHVNLKSPNFQQALSFKQQIRYIDAAINGKAPALYTEPRKDKIVTRKVNTQLLTNATWVKKEPVIISGLVKEAQHQMDTIRPQDLSIMIGKQ